MALRVGNIHKKRRGKLFTYVVILILVAGFSFGTIYLFNKYIAGSEN